MRPISEKENEQLNWFKTRENRERQKHRTKRKNPSIEPRKDRKLTNSRTKRKK